MICSARAVRPSATSTVPPWGRAGVFRPCRDTGRGSSTVNRLPRPSALSTWMEPPMLSTIRLTMAMPSPVPSIRLMVVL